MASAVPAEAHDRLPAQAVPAQAPAQGLSADPFDELTRRWRELAVARGVTGTAAATHRDTMASADAWLWPGLPYPSLRETPSRLLAMARAHVVSGDATLAIAVATGLEHYTRRVYTAGADEEGNWWDWQIGAPKKLLEAALLTGYRGRALLDAVDHFVPECRLDDYSGTSTGANRVDLCTVMLLRAILGNDRDRAALAVSALTPATSYVTEGDGVYRDGSFVQHSTIPYQGGYGVVWLSGLATLMAVLRGSPWEVQNRQIVFDSVERSFVPFVHRGTCMDLVRGRGIGRPNRTGRDLADTILLLGESASPGERARWRGVVKGWGLLDDDTVAAIDEPVGHRLMPMSARAVHRRKDWCAALSMASSRIGHYEHGNGENLRGWHTGSGMLYWWAGSDPYTQFWRTADPYRLPGTTVSTKRLADGAGEAWGDTCPPGRWVGGATDGTYATVGQHLTGLESTLDAFKSWFFLDDAVVCLGAGITCEDGVAVETVVDNRRTDAALTVETGWAHLEGHGGYVLPCASLRTARERGHTTLWLDHGVDPSGSGYLYQLMPGATMAQTRARAADPEWARVLANTSRQQGVDVPSLGITAVNFWNPGTAGPLTADAPCAVLVVEKGDGTATVTVSDPRMDLDEVNITWTTRALAFRRLAQGGSQTVRIRL